MNIQGMNAALFTTAVGNAMSMGVGAWGTQMPQISNQMQQLQTRLAQNANVFSSNSSQFQTFGQTFRTPVGMGAVAGFGFLNAPRPSSLNLAQSMQGLSGMGGMQNGLTPTFNPKGFQLNFMHQFASILQKTMQILTQVMQSTTRMNSNIMNPIAQNPHMGPEIPSGTSRAVGGFMNSGAAIGTNMKAGFMGGFIAGGFVIGGGKAEVAKPKPAPKPAPKPKPAPVVERGGVAVSTRAEVNTGFNAIREGGDGGDGGGDGGDPLAFDLNGDGRIGVTGASTAQIRKGDYKRGRTVEFDLDGDGIKDRTEWMAGGGDGLLIDNRDGKAATDMNGKRLFGDEGGTFKDGIAKLKHHDLNNDGKISGDELKGLEMWIDNGDAKVQAGEIKTLAELGIKEISVERNVVKNANGEELMRSTATREDGSKIMTEDVWFAGDFSKQKA